MITAVVGIAYLALAQYVIWLNDPVNAGAGYWPAAGVALVVLVLLPERRWGWVAGAIAAAEIGGDALHGYPVAASSWWAAGNILEPVVGALIVRRFGGARLSSLAGLIWFLIGGVLIGPLVGAVVGSIGTATEFGGSHLEILLKWWAGDGLGVLVVAPMLFSLRENAIPGRPRVEVVVTAVAVGAVSAVAFHNWNPEWDVVLPYVIFPLLMWASVRLGVQGAAVAGFIVAETANLTTALGQGPFSLVADTDRDAVITMQVFVASALTAALMIAALVHDALERTRQYQRQRSIAGSLQSAALPSSLPAIAGTKVAARYVPASTDESVHIGGDWYDAFELADGSVAFIVGDVVGHDLDAAVLMTQLRNGMRALMVEMQDANRVLEALDRQLVATTDTALASAIIAVYANGALRWTNAGHPPLLLAPANGPVRYLSEGTGRILGTGTGRYESHLLALQKGDLIVAVTDGVIEHRSWSLEEGFDSLAQLVARSDRSNVDSVCDLVIAEALRGRPRDDDACVLALLRS